MKTRRLWAVLVFAAVLLEIIGLRRRTADDTLSEYVWSKTKTGGMRALVVGVITWLAYHFSLGADGRPIGWLDYASALLGVVLGAASAAVRRKGETETLTSLALRTNYAVEKES